MRLIDADALKNEVYNERKVFIINNYEELLSKDDVCALIEGADTIDAEPIVRCKDCKHSAIDKYVKRRFCVLNGEIRPNGHVWYGVGVTDDHYCSHGAKMDGEKR